ncbi:hypothetical protein Adt_05692 [Abeliophyllum distichum]|uniref:Uncharacterized protein n=1 Tax=Abeliophyllum distichum TaxID=126358 RepID=A0ABD1V581_9LAMI
MGNTGFPKVLRELNFYASPSPLLDQTCENLDMIEALDGIYGLKDLPYKYPNHISRGILASKLVDINGEEKANYGTSLVKIPKSRQEASVSPFLLSLIVVPTSNTSIPGPPPRVTKDSPFLKSIF